MEMYSNLSILFSDGVKATIKSFNIKRLYEGVIEESPGTFTRLSERILNEIRQKNDEVRSGKKKGRYILEPQLIDETEYWSQNLLDYYKEIKKPFKCGKCLKEYMIEVGIQINGDEGRYSIKIEWYLTEKDIITTPILDISQNAISGLTFEEIRDYCNYFDWADL